MSSERSSSCRARRRCPPEARPWKEAGLSESTDSDRAYGEGDATHQALGGVDAIRRLVEVFYEEMDTLPEAATIRRLHPSDLEVSIDKLARFLSGWTGGPKLYSEKYGPIKIPVFHQHLPVGEAERDAWLLCMERALGRLDYPDDLSDDGELNTGRGRIIPTTPWEAMFKPLGACTEDSNTHTF